MVLGPVGIRRLLMVIALLAYGFALLPDYSFLVVALSFDVVAAWPFLFYPKLKDLIEPSPKGELSSGPAVVTMVDEVIYVLCVGLAFFLWPESFGLPDGSVRFIVAVIIATVMLTIGVVAPLLPYDPYARLRPSWSVANEALWQITNRLLGYGSCPLAIAYIACLPTFGGWVGLGILTALTALLWLAIPALLSYGYFRKHYAAS